ncbi:NHL repeat-containing protein [Algoriphagus chordae]|nr:hypothetical protein [Algoriphagus chordae]
MPSYKLEVLDSVTVKDILATLFLFQTADDEHLLFKDAMAAEIYVFDKAGNPIEKWNKKGDVPGSFSNLNRNISTDKSGNLVIVDIINGLKVLKKNGDLIQDFGIHYTQMSFSGPITIFKSQQVIEKDGKDYLLYSLDVMEDLNGDFGPDFFHARKNLLLTNLETEETKAILPFPEGSQFLNGNMFLFEDFRPVFSYDEQSQMLYVAFQNEPIMYSYDWSGLEPILKDKTNLDLAGFVAGTGFEKGAVGYGKPTDNKINPFPSQIISLEKYGNDFLISYKPTPSDKSGLAKMMAGEATKEVFWRLFEESKIKTVVLTAKGNLIPLDLPEMNTDSFKVIGEDIWWMKKHTGEEEQEDFTVYRGRLVKE